MNGVKHIAKDNRVCVLCGSYCYIVDLLFSVVRQPFHNVGKANISQMLIFSQVTKKKPGWSDALTFLEQQ